MQTAATHPLAETLVALDLETTGVDARKDRVIEVGAVKFRGDEEIAQFSVMVNPRIEIPQFVTNLTGIKQSDVDFAPEWQQVAPELEAFIGGSRLVGHQVSFDVNFLRRNGIDIDSGSYDTLEMARVALPRGPEFGLERLSRRFGIGHDSPHRALSDAIATKELFLLLLAEIEQLPTQILRRLSGLASADVWPTAGLARGLVASRRESPGEARFGAYGIDEDALSEKLSIEGVASAYVRGDASDGETDSDFPNRVDAMFSENGLLARTFPMFETRGGQREMARAVATSLVDGTNAIIGAGTGIGKTLA